MTREEYVKKLVADGGHSLRSFAELINLPYTTFLSMLTRGLGGASIDNVFKVCKGLNITVEELQRVESDDIPRRAQSISDDDKKLVKKFNMLDTHGKRVVTAVLDEEVQRVKEIAERAAKRAANAVAADLTSVITYDLPASAGTGVFLESDYYEHINYPADAVPNGTDFAVKISGDSMFPEYTDGSVAFVRVQEEIKAGDVGVFIVNGSGYIKRLQYEGSSPYLESANPDYEDIRLTEGDIIRCVGRVLN